MHFSFAGSGSRNMNKIETYRAYTLSIPNEKENEDLGLSA